MTTKQKSDALNIEGATPGASQVLADEGDEAPRKPQRKAATKKPATKKAAKAKAKKLPKVAATTKVPRESKQAAFIAAMRTAKGISITEAAERFGWQPHTVRGAVAGALKTKLKLKVATERDEKRGTVYRIK